MQNKMMMGWFLRLLCLGMMVFMVVNSSRTSPSPSPSPSASASASSSSDDITCKDAITKLMSCTGYLSGSDPPTPSVSCCLACQDVFQAANTTAVRRDLCVCLKEAAIEYKIVPDRAKQLPQLCNLQGLDVPLDPSVDCSTIKLY